MKRAFRLVSIDELKIEDARALRSIPLLGDLREVLRRAHYRFRVLRDEGRADHALLLNLTYWSPEAQGDVLATPRIPVDVVAHVAWHHLATRALAPPGGTRNVKPTADALFLGESIASAFDLWLVGRLLRGGARSAFLESQVPRMADVAEAAGLPKRGFERMLAEIAADPERAFGDLRALLFDATSRLHEAETAEAAAAVLADAEAHRFGALLHHYELSNWVIYARAYGASRKDARARKIDAALRLAADPVAWLVSSWVLPALHVKASSDVT